jgi:Protein of unknown function (DUF3088)
MASFRNVSIPNRSGDPTLGRPVLAALIRNKAAMLRSDPMARDRLFLLRPDFEDPAYPGRRFYCWHCALIEGVLASFPALATKLDVERIAWPKPRQAVIELVGEENQSLPLLVLADGATSSHSIGSYRGRSFIADKDAILAALSERHRFPEPHP